MHNHYVGESQRAADIDATAVKIHDDERRNATFTYGTLFGGLDGARIAWEGHDHVFAADQCEQWMDPQRTPVRSVYSDFFRMPRKEVREVEILLVSPPRPNLTLSETGGPSVYYVDGDY